MKILTNSNTVFGEIEKIVENSRDFIYIISPFIRSELKDQVSYDKFRKTIEIAIKKGIDINFISKQPSLNSKINPEVELKEFIDEGCKLYLVPNLHTKLYCNESKALITSMNLYMHSIINNEEIGVKISKKNELKEFEKILYYIFKLKLKSNKSDEIKQHNQSDVEILSDYIGKDIDYIYVLKLENGKWWVGKTTNIERRINKIRKGIGPPWTIINRMIKVEEVRENANLKEVTLEYMQLYGWENVRGYAWSQWNMERPPKELRGILEPWEAKKHSRNGGYLIYVLKLHNGKWFIGKTTNIQSELTDHNLELISPFTSVNKVLKLEELIENGNFEQVVSSYTKKYGEENIRAEF